jgi:hypothetical protein
MTQVRLGSPRSASVFCTWSIQREADPARSTRAQAIPYTRSTIFFGGSQKRSQGRQSKYFSADPRLYMWGLFERNDKRFRRLCPSLMVSYHQEVLRVGRPIFGGDLPMLQCKLDICQMYTRFLEPLTARGPVPRPKRSSLRSSDYRPRGMGAPDRS